MTARPPLTRRRVSRFAPPSEAEQLAVLFRRTLAHLEAAADHFRAARELLEKTGIRPIFRRPAGRRVVP